MTTRTSWPSAVRAFGKLPATSPRPPTLARGYASAEANRIFIGISGWTCGLDLNLRPERRSPRSIPWRNRPIDPAGAFAKDFSLDVHAEADAARSARSPPLRVSHPSAMGPRPRPMAARRSMAPRGDGRVLSPPPAAIGSPREGRAQGIDHHWPHARPRRDACFSSVPRRIPGLLTGAEEPRGSGPCGVRRGGRPKPSGRRRGPVRFLPEGEDPLRRHLVSGGSRGVLEGAQTGGERNNRVDCPPPVLAPPWPG